MDFIFTQIEGQMGSDNCTTVEVENKLSIGTRQMHRVRCVSSGKVLWEQLLTSPVIAVAGSRQETCGFDNWSRTATIIFQHKIDFEVVKTRLSQTQERVYRILQLLTYICTLLIIQALSIKYLFIFWSICKAVYKCVECDLNYRLV